MMVLLTAFLLIFLFAPYAIVVSTASNTPGASRYFDVTNDVTLEVTPEFAYNGFTKDLSLRCRFFRQEDSDFETLVALILSKNNLGSKNYSELAAYTSAAGDQMEQKDSLGADVTGAFTTDAESHITYKWTWPERDIGGRYYCEAHGLDSKGHPRISTASVEVVVKQTLDAGVVLKTIQDLEARLENCSIDKQLGIKDLDQVKASLEELKSGFNEFRSRSTGMAAMVRDAVFEPGVTWGNHTYFISQPVTVDVEDAQHVCVLLGGYLIEINDRDEYEFAINMTDKLESYGYPFVGSWDRGHEGNWTFIRSGEPMTFFDWNPNEPNGGERENCLHINWSTGKKMNDLLCKGLRARFLCEIP